MDGGCLSDEVLFKEGMRDFGKGILLDAVPFNVKRDDVGLRRGKRDEEGLSETVDEARDSGMLDVGCIRLGRIGC